MLAVSQDDLHQFLKPHNGAHIQLEKPYKEKKNVCRDVD